MLCVLCSTGICVLCSTGVCVLCSTEKTDKWKCQSAGIESVASVLKSNICVSYIDSQSNKIRVYMSDKGVYIR